MLTSRPNRSIDPGEVDEFVSAGPAGQPAACACAGYRLGVVVVGAGFVHPIDQHLDLAAEPGPVALESDPLLEREELVQPRPLDVGRDIVIQLRRWRSGALGVGRREDLVVADGLEEPQRRAELGVGLAAEPHDDIGRDRDPRHGLPDAREPLEIVLDRVLAAHPAQDRIVAGLDRQVQVLADALALGERGDEPVGQVPWVRGDEAQSPDGRPPVRSAEAVDGPDQLGEIGTTLQIEPTPGPALGVHVGEPRIRWQVVSVRVHVLAEERDLAVAGGRQRPRLVDDLVERPAPLRTPAEGHDAVGARLVAAVDDRQPGADGRTARDGPLPDGASPRPRQPIGDADDRPAHDRRGADGPDGRLRRGKAESVDELGLLVRAQEHVHGRIPVPQAGAIGLPHGAARQHHPQARVRVLEPRELALPADDLLLGALADRAGVDDDEVGVLEAGRLGTAGLQQAAGHLLGVAAVHLAAERPDVEARQRPSLGQVLGDPLVPRGRRQARRRVRRWRGHLEHRQRAIEQRTVGHRSGREPTPMAVSMPSATSGGTHRRAWDSAYVPVSP